MTSARTTLRRGAGLLALLSALLLAATMLMIPPVSADTPTCKDVAGYEPVGNLTDGVEEDWGSTEFTQDNGPLLLTVNEGYTVMLCLKKGTEPIESGPYTGPIEDQPVYYDGPDEEGFSHYSWRLVEDEPDTADVTLVKAWQDAQGNPVDAPEGVTWEATLTLDDGSSTVLTVSDTAGDSDTTTTDDGTGYTVTEDDSSEDFDEVQCSEAVLAGIASTHGDADTIDDGTGTGAVAGETVHVVCNTVPETTTEEVTWDLTVDKAVAGPGNPGPYAFDVTCDDGTEATLSLSDQESDTVEGIAEDAACTVTETNAPSGATVTITTSDGGEADGTTIELAPRSEDLTVSYVNAFAPPTPPDEVDVEPDEVVSPAPQEEEPEDVAVLPNVVEKPAPTTPPTVAAADELPRTGLSSTQMLLLSLLLMGLGAVMILGPEGRRES